MKSGIDTSIVYCDGACSGNPGPGGWGSIVATPDGRVRELGGGARGTTNNQMELTAAIEALRELEGVFGEVIVLTDSVYVIRGITQWIWGWMRNGWKTSEGKEVLNQELWQELGRLVTQRKKQSPGASGAVNWRYVRGHTGIAGNERCDEIAVQFSKNLSASLYDGPVEGYRFNVFQLPVDQGLPERSGDKKSSKAAHSYLSLLGGTALRHRTWAECERRVKGQPGAKFKKAASSDDETSILKSWGIDPKTLKNG